MRLTLIAVPVVLLGAGGYYLWHSSSQPAITPTAHHAPVPGTITTGDGRVLPAPVTHPNANPGSVVQTGSDGSPMTSATGTAPALPPDVAPATGSASPAPAAARVDVHGQEYLRAHDRLGSGAEKKLAVPMPGLGKLQNKIGTQAKCQGPDAEQHYAALSSQERLDFARNCKRVGIVLPQ